MNSSLSRPALGALTTKRVPPVERLLALVVLFFSTAARIPFLSSLDAADPGPALTMSRYGAYLIAALLLLGFYRSVTGSMARAPSLILLSALAFFSTTWSHAPGVTAEQAVILLGMTAFALYFAVRFTIEDFLYLLAQLTAVIAVLSLLFIAIPGSGAIDESGAWRGVFVHKNVLGQHMALGVLVWFFVLRIGSWHRITAGAFLLLCTLLMLQSGSATALVIAIGVLVSVPLLHVAAAGSASAGLLLIGTGIITPLLAIRLGETYEGVLRTLGRDPSLTGRTELWDAIWDEIRDHPWLGYGYEAFWLGRSGPSGQLEPLLGFLPAHAHNGFLDAWLALGVLGLLLLLASFVIVSARAARYLSTQGDLMRPFPCAMVIFILIYNLVESSLVVQPGLIWIVFVALYTRLALWSLGAREQSRPSTRNPVGAS